MTHTPEILLTSKREIAEANEAIAELISLIERIPAKFNAGDYSGAHSLAALALRPRSRLEQSLERLSRLSLKFDIPLPSEVEL